MFKYIFLLYVICFVVSCRSDPASMDTEAYEEQKQNLADKEQSKPLVFLHINSEYRKNWIGQTVVSGTIINVATVTSYKNVRLRMLCYDNTHKMVEEHEDLLDAIIKPNTEREFKLRYRLPRSTDSVRVGIMSAEIVK